MKKIFNGKYGVTENGEVYSFITNKFLKAAKDPKGYFRVGLMLDGKLVTKKVHRLVCEQFVDNPDNKPFVNHKDGVKTNNSVSNLEWCTPKENTHHAIKIGLFVFTTPETSVNITPKKGELNGFSILKEEQVLDIRATFKPRVNTRRMLAQKHGVTVSCIKDILSRKSWKHLCSY